MLRTGALGVVFLLAAAGGAWGQIGTAFSYQGRLADGGKPASGTFDFQLILYDARTGGAQVGDIVTVNDVIVANGVFAISLDFGPVFTGTTRWLDIGVRPGASTGEYSILSPRQELTPTPYALHSASATTVAGLTCANADVPKWSGSGWACGTDNFAAYSAGGGLDLSGATFSVDNTVARKDAASGDQAFDDNLLFLDYTNNRVGIGTVSPAGHFHVQATSGAMADHTGTAVVLAAQNGGSDGSDADTTGGLGGQMALFGGAGGPGQRGGAVSLFGNAGGAATSASPGGNGSPVGAVAGLGGDSAFSTSAGRGGDLTIRGGPGGHNTGTGPAGIGGYVFIFGGNGGTPNGPAGDVRLVAGDGNGSGRGGYITLLPGQSPTGHDGAIQLGGEYGVNLSTPGTVRVHVVNGDMHLATNGTGIILRSPSGTCRRLSINDSGALVTLPATCP